MTLCAVCTVHMEMRKAGFLVEPQNQGRRFPGLGLKINSSGLMIWVSKSPLWVSWLSLKTKRAVVSWFGPQNRQLRFGDLVFKITASVSWFGPQNQVGFGLSVTPQNRHRDLAAYFV
jgi:hypothetical protein